MAMKPTPENHQRTVLLVDDDKVILSSVTKILADANYKVLTADSGAAALRESKAYKGAISLVLSDFQMVGMTGVELATQLTKHRPGIKILLMSSFTDGMLVLNEGWHFLAKPFIPSQLRTLVSGLVFPDNPSRFSKDGLPRLTGGSPKKRASVTASKDLRTGRSVSTRVREAA
jgi:DNA-binding NtrC family response regulator